MKGAGFQGRFGVARADITPPVGIYARNWGASLHEVCVGIHRRLTATALAVSDVDGNSPLVMICADLGWWRAREDEETVRCPLLHTLGLQQHQLLLCLSHTHSGPSTSRNDRDKPGGDLIAPYLHRLTTSLAEAAHRALEKMEPGVLSWRTGWCDLAQNRDLLTEDGHTVLTGWNGVTMPPTPVTVLDIRNGKERTATVVHYACHPTTLGPGNRLISPDYIGAMREVVETHTQRPCLYLHGAAGNLAPALQYSDDTALADRHGYAVGHAAVSALHTGLDAGCTLQMGGVLESGAPLALWEQQCGEISPRLCAGMSAAKVPVKPALQSISQIDAEMACETDRARLERLVRRRRITDIVDGLAEYPMPFWVWQLGDLEIVAQPNELFPPPPQANRLYVNCANGPYLGYLPSGQAYDYNNYPVWQTPLERGCLEEFLRQADTASTELRNSRRNNVRKQPC
jgi:hypothetical protein